MKPQKRVFGWIEAVFDSLYLLAAFSIGIYLLRSDGSQVRVLAGSMAILLAAGDAFHLVPRIGAILIGQEERLARVLGFGKLLTSVTMTVFYLLLWQIGLLLFAPTPGSGWTAFVYVLAALRILLCLFPQNRWADRHPPVRWGIYRNIPFLLLGAAVAVLFAVNTGRVPAVDGMWIAIALSYAFYIPVVLWSNTNPKLGMLMLPKTCAYLWILAMCLFL